MQEPGALISITEDDPAVREGLQLLLERAGYRTVAHTNPRQVLQETDLSPDIFILDRQLCGIDGLEACRKLKSATRTALVPVIIISATPHVARLAEAVGADGFLEKPFRSAELLTLIRSCLAKAGKK